MALAVDEPASNAPRIQLPSESNVQWGQLSNRKIAAITLCDREGRPKLAPDGSVLETPVVEALLTEGELAIESQWQTPFENISPEAKMPSLLAMLQAGELATSAGKVFSLDNPVLNNPLVRPIVDGIAQIGDLLGNPLKGIGFGKFTDAVSSLEGKTNLTKVNSTNIFLHTMPVRMTLTLFFMALKDARREVEDQISQLQQWALPEYLAPTTLVERFATGQEHVLFPSTAPPFISLTYSGKTYLPFVIESVSSPLVGPTDDMGSRLSLSVTMTIASRQAWDASDIQSLYAPINVR